MARHSARPAWQVSIRPGLGNNHATWHLPVLLGKLCLGSNNLQLLTDIYTTQRSSATCARALAWRIPCKAKHIKATHPGTAAARRQ